MGESGGRRHPSLMQDPVLAGLESEESISLLELLTNGGYMMLPILILWMVAIYIFVERTRTLSAAAKTPLQLFPLSTTLPKTQSKIGADVDSHCEGSIY